MDTSSRIGSLHPPDNGEMAVLLEDLRRQARRKVQAEWLLQHGDLRQPSVFSAWRAASAAAVANAETRMWTALDSGAVAGRCQHGASSANCLIRGCSHQFPWVKPSISRYATGSLRQADLERDRFRCTYCHRLVDDSLPRDDPAKANIDHVVPYPEGRTRIDNLVTACGACNREKGVGEAMRDDEGRIVGFWPNMSEQTSVDDLVKLLAKEVVDDG